MRKILTCIFAASLLILICVFVLVYPAIVHAIRFESRHSEVTELIEGADPEDRQLPSPVRDLLVFALRGRTAPYATRLLIGRFDEEAFSEQSQFNAVSVGWYPLVALRFSEQDRLAIIARLAYTGGERRGLSDTSRALFNRPLSGLSLTEAATLIALATNPALYNKPERVNEERDRFLSRFRQRSRP